MLILLRNRMGDLLDLRVSFDSTMYTRNVIILLFLFLPQLFSSSFLLPRLGMTERTIRHLILLQSLAGSSA